MTIKNLKTSELMEKIATVATQIKNTVALFESGGLVHETACECLLHASLHGDVMPSQRLYEACGGALDSEGRRNAQYKSIIKAEAIKAWFVKMSGNQYTARNGTWGLKDKWRPDAFLLDLAEATPIQSFAPDEQKVRAIYADQILNQIDNFLERVQEKSGQNTHGENGDVVYFVGDPKESALALRDIREFAAKRLDQADPKTIGRLKEGNVIVFQEKAQPKAEDKLLRNGEEVVQEAAVG